LNKCKQNKDKQLRNTTHINTYYGVPARQTKEVAIFITREREQPSTTQTTTIAKMLKPYTSRWITIF